MADTDDEFSFLTDSEDEKAVQDVLSQARDHSVLEQIAAINCSSFDHTLPTHLETRFRNLKSQFPAARSKSFTPQSVVDFDQIPDLNSSDKVSKSKTRLSSSSSETPSPKTGTKSKPKSKTRDSSSSSSSESETPLPKPGTKSKLKSIATSFKSMRRSISSLWSSPKTEKRKQGKVNRSLSSTSFGDFDDVEFLKSFSIKEQRKIMKQEEKINREADKIVKWAKQTSDRIMKVSGVHHLEEDELSRYFQNTK